MWNIRKNKQKTLTIGKYASSNITLKYIKENSKQSEDYIEI